MIDRDVIPAEQIPLLEVHTDDREQVTAARRYMPLSEYLYRRGTINSQMFDAAEKYLAYQTRHRNKQGMRAALLDETQRGSDTGENLYTAVLARLKANEILWIEIVVHRTAGHILTREQKVKVRQCLSSLHDAIESAITAYENACAQH